MKTTKKGFTLIELIVVIAIIGVLAAILVPTMLGYVKKSKISSANSAAASVYKAINSALTELDEEGIDVGGLWILTWDGHKWGTTADTVTLSTGDVGNLGHEDQLGTDKKFDRKVSNFFEDISKVRAGQAAIKGGSCVALAIATDTTYTGTYPAGIVTTDSYELYEDNTKTALQDAIAVASGEVTVGELTEFKEKKVSAKAYTITNADFNCLRTGAKDKKASDYSKTEKK
ncbi:MAG: prepilin-type N-terminal cleavage/methylation domain-containing protein [Ruminococcus sp.]|nr:prepilin-type N-terminal cleavage/methylation domain-containing protein [Ruminococcus sp.]